MGKEHSTTSPLGSSRCHESAIRHVTGAAKYVDDIEGVRGELIGMTLMSPQASGRIITLDVSEAKSMLGVHAVLTVDDIPGDPMIGPIFHDEPLFAKDHVHYHGQPIALVVAESRERCRQAIKKIHLEIEATSPILSIQDAITVGSFHNEPHIISRGDLNWSSCEHVIEGTVSNGGQDHFYLETQAALALPLENGSFHIHSSTQHPTEIQKMVASVLGIGANKVNCEVARMGGGFGGKESQATQPAAMAALGALVTNRSVRVWLNRDEDMCQTGNRHPFHSIYKCGFDEEGRILAFEVDIFSNGGWSSDLSLPVLDRALFHLDNAYFIPNLRFSGLVCRTNLPSNTAFRGFGGPQGVLVIEEAINLFSERNQRDPAVVRRLNYYGDSPRNTAPYGQEIRDNRMARIHDELMTESEYSVRRKEIDSFNINSKYLKRGIGFQAVKFGISFTKSVLNQAGALVQIYTDGTVQLNHGGTEMGQGLYTKMTTVCAHTLGIPYDAVRNMNTATDKVPNTSATAASSGSDLNGQAVKAACVTLMSRLKPVALSMFSLSSEEGLHFEGGLVQHRDAPGVTFTFSDVANQAWLEQISLSATGFYATPGIVYDQSKGRGTPFYYFAYGGAVTEVEINILTGEHRILRTDIIHDVGDSLSPDIDLGQVEGAYIQGVGWLTCEEPIYDKNGRFLTHSPSTYKIPTIGDVPDLFNVRLLEKAPQHNVIYGSKAVGEPPFVLAISVVTALRHAILSVNPSRKEVDLGMPSTPESILRSIYRQTGEAIDNRDDIVLY